MTTMSENVSATGLNNSKYHLNKVWNNFVKEITGHISLGSLSGNFQEMCKLF